MYSDSSSVVARLVLDVLMSDLCLSLFVGASVQSTALVQLHHYHGQRKVGGGVSDGFSVK